MRTSIPCRRCPRLVTPTVAAASRTATGEALCGLCRRRRFPVYPSPHQAPHGCLVTVKPSGYGLFSCELEAPNGTVFTASGLTDELALSRARSKALAAGALRAQ